MKAVSSSKAALGTVLKRARALAGGGMANALRVLPQLVEFRNSRPEDRQSQYDRTKDPLANSDYFAALKERLSGAGVSVEEVEIDAADFERWLGRFSAVRKFYKKMGDVFIEKCLEHYLVFSLLKISENDVYIDVGAAGSPWATILRKRGIKSYRLDLAYPQGVHGMNIGADAGRTGLPDGFATVLSSQCAYECFMGNSDVMFVKEAARILNENGRYGIVPLYLDDTYFNYTSPYRNQRRILIDAGAKRVWRDDGYTTSFSRHYSPESFKERVYDTIPKTMSGKVLYFSNLREMMERYPQQRVYCCYMFVGEKCGVASKSSKRG